MASVPGLNPQFDNLSVATINNWASDRFEDVYSSHHPVILKIWMNGNAKMKGDGHGYGYVAPFYIPVSTGNQPIGIADDYAELPDVQEDGGKSAFRWTPSMHVLQFMIPTYDDRAQGSETEKIDYLQTELDLSITKMLEYQNRMLFAPEGQVGANGMDRRFLASLLCLMNGGGANTTGTGPVAPLAQQLTVAVGTNPLTNIAGVERNAANAAYQCVCLQNPVTADNPSLQLMNRTYNLAVRGKDSPDLIIMPRDLYGYIETTLQSQTRYGNSDSQLAKLGFEAVRFKGADVVFDDLCPSSALSGVANTNQIFMLNTKKLKMYYDTMKPQFQLLPDPKRVGKYYRAEMIMQLVSSNLGRVHSRHAHVADPA